MFVYVRRKGKNTERNAFNPIHHMYTNMCIGYPKPTLNAIRNGTSTFSCSALDAYSAFGFHPVRTPQHPVPIKPINRTFLLFRFASFFRVFVISSFRWRDSLSCQFFLQNFEISLLFWGTVVCVLRSVAQIMCVVCDCVCVCVVYLYEH